MRNLFRPWSRHTGSLASQSHTRRPRRHHLGLECLEGRQLLSLGGELGGPQSSLGPQELPVTASAPDGRSVVAWVDRSVSTNRRIEFRLFTAAGNPVTGDIAVPGSSGNAS